MSGDWDDQSHVDRVVSFLLDASATSVARLLVAPRARLELLRRLLEHHRLPVQFLTSHGALVMVDVDEVLHRRGRTNAGLSAILDSIHQEAARVHVETLLPVVVYSELTAALLRTGDEDSATVCEHLWDGLSTVVPLRVLCHLDVGVTSLQLLAQHSEHEVGEVNGQRVR